MSLPALRTLHRCEMTAKAVPMTAHPHADLRERLVARVGCSHRQPKRLPITTANGQTPGETMTPEQHVQKLTAELREVEQQLQQLRDDQQRAQRALDAARAELGRAKSAGGREPEQLAALGQLTLHVHEQEEEVEQRSKKLAARGPGLEAAAAAARDKLIAARRNLERAKLHAMVIEYQNLVAPAWRLAQQIRTQASLCGVAIERQGPLLDPEFRTVAGYPLEIPTVA